MGLRPFKPNIGLKAQIIRILPYNTLQIIKEEFKVGIWHPKKRLKMDGK